MRKQTARMSREHPLLIACLLVLVGAGAGYAVAGPVSGEFESALLVGSTTLIFGGLLGGAVKFLLEEVQRLREQRQEQTRFLRQVLDDLKSVYDRVQRARIMIAADQSALTYGREMGDLIDSAVQLRNVRRALDNTSGVLEHHEENLSESVKRMTEYLEALVREFQDNYKRIADKQTAYESAVNRARESDPPAAAPPNPAWRDLIHLKYLAEFIGKDSDSPLDYERDFGETLDLATWILRAELKRLADGSRLEIPDQYAPTVAALDPDRACDWQTHANTRARGGGRGASEA